MARGDFRYTSRYQFWAAIVLVVLVVLVGAGLSWLIEADGTSDAAGRVARTIPIFIGMFSL